MPAAPSGFDGSARLVPRDAPVTAVLCRYATKQASARVAPGARDALNGVVPLRGDLRALADELTWLPGVPRGWGRGCTAMDGPTRGYLLGLTYADGRRVWVGAPEDPNSCADTRNGSFTAATYLGQRMAAAYRTGAWQDVVSTAASRPCAQSSWAAYGGRLGAETTLVPDGETSVTVCVEGGSTTRLRVEQWRPVLQALRAVSTEPFTGGFSCPNPRPPYRQLRIGYRQGPGVVIWLRPDCDGRVASPMRTGTDTGGTVQRALDDALRQAARNPAPAPATTPIACPPTRRMPTPARDASAALVPVLIPGAAVTCAYTASGRLSSTRQVRSLTGAGDWLPWYPRATSRLSCVPMVTGAAPRRAAASYLVGLRYADGLRWLDAGSPPRGRRCTPATNGAFVARTSLYGAVAQTHAVGTWSEGMAPGRLGDDRALVPPGMVATVNVFAPKRSGTTTGPRLVAIVGALRGLPARPVASGVTAWTPAVDGYQIAIDYGFGSAVVLQVTGRTVTGGALRATLTPAQARRLVAAIEAVLPRPRR